MHVNKIFDSISFILRLPFIYILLKNGYKVKNIGVVNEKENNFMCNNFSNFYGV